MTVKIDPGPLPAPRDWQIGLGMRPRRMRKGQSNHCFLNAYRLADGTRLRYCEGWTWSASGSPWHHAWCVGPDDAVVDPTWSELGTRYYGIAIPWTTARRLVAHGYRVTRAHTPCLTQSVVAGSLLLSLAPPVLALVNSWEDDAKRANSVGM